MPKRRANGEGTIFQRKDGRWVSQYTDIATGKQKSIHGKTQQEVKYKLKNALNDMENGINLDKSNMPFVEWIWEWLEVYSKPRVRESTYANYYYIIKIHVEPFFPRVLLRDITCDMLQRFYNEKLINGRKDGAGRGISVKSVDNIMMVISCALKRAVLNGMIYTNEASKIVHSKKPKKKLTY